MINIIEEKNFNDYPEVLEPKHIRQILNIGEKQTYELLNHEPSPYIDLGKIAKNFINNYFNYKKKPNRKEVELFATNQALSKLQFKESEGVEEGNVELDSVKSEGSNLNIYYGKSVDDRQEIVVIFENKIKLNGAEESIANTVVHLDMKNNEEVWKVADVTLFQY